MKHLRRSGIWAVMICFLLSGCNLYDDMDNCDLYLRFTYTYHMQQDAELFAEQVEQVRVFVFDPAGGYVATLSETNAERLKEPSYQMPVPYYMHGYQAVVWAGRTEDSYALPQLKAGEQMDDLTLRLASGTASSSDLAPLWHSGPAMLTFPDNYNRKQTLPLVRTTNNVDATLRAQKTDLSGYRVRIVADNGRYDYRHTIVPAAEVTYSPHTLGSYVFDPDAGQQQDFLQKLTTMRLVEGQRVVLSIVDRTSADQRLVSIGGQTKIYLIEWLLQTKPAGMTAQEYLDREYLWNVSFDIDGYSALSITINGWTKWFHETGL